MVLRRCLVLHGFSWCAVTSAVVYKVTHHAESGPYRLFVTILQAYRADL